MPRSRGPLVQCLRWPHSLLRPPMHRSIVQHHHAKVCAKQTIIHNYHMAMVVMLLHLAAVATSDGETCHRSPDNHTVVHFSQCPFGCCQCDRCHPDKPGYDGDVWSQCGNKHWCEASARGFWWIIGTAVAAVLGLVVLCAGLDWCGKRGSNEASQP